MQITIELDEPLAEGGTIENMLIDRAAAKVADSVERDVRGDLRAQIRGVTADELRKLIGPLLQGALDGLVQPTDSFGNPRGPVKTLHEVILEMAREELRKPTDRYDSNKPSVLQKLIREEVQRTIRTELQQALKEAREEVIGAVKAEGATVLAETIARLART